jgi:aminoacrylate hydrolase
MTIPDYLDRPDGRLAYDVNGSGPPLLPVTGLAKTILYPLEELDR